MKSNLFDDLTKALATAGSRRQALKAMGVALAGALGLGASRVGIVPAACHPDGDHCAKDKDCCSGHCNKPKNGPGICVSGGTTGTALGFSSLFELGGFHEV
jgi:hypothetical protein